MPCNKRMTGCHANCAHREMVRDYWAERERQETQAEEDYRDRDGNERAAALINFKQWITGRKRTA